MTGEAAGVPPINFVAHRLRAGEGAWADFEQMLGQLIQATEGQAHLVHANPGDWGIDAFVGELSGRVAIWQAKYYINGVKPHHHGKIDTSFTSAIKSSERHGFLVERWVLCVPVSLDGPTWQWWERWRAETARPGLRIELWDANQLAERLARPEADRVRRLFYEPYMSAGARQPPSVPPPIPPDRRWQGGNEVLAGGASYLLHEDAVERVAADHAWTWREATADRIEPELARVWLRQVEATRAGPGGTQAREALRLQARLLRGGGRGLPRLVGCYEGPESTTLVVYRPTGPTWREAFGPAPTVPDRLTAAATLAAAAAAGTALGQLHRWGYAHRALDPDGILLADRPGRTLLRDLGLAGLPPRAGEGRPDYRASEQVRSGGTPPGPPADVYQLGAMVYHTLTGHPPSASATPPLRASLPALPEALDGLILRALATDPHQRPALGALVGALRAGRQQLSLGGVR